MSEYRSPDAERSCYHCGLPVASGDRFLVEIDGGPRAMCCAGCQAVAEAIVAAGLHDYYRHRDALPEQQREAMPAALAELGLFDHPEFQKSFVRPVGPDEREADLILEGITCAACVWLNEQHIAAQPGVTVVQVNYATRRARVRWREGEAKLSGILAAIAAIGYRAHPYDPQKNEMLAQQERRSALWRLLVAGFGMMQVMMYAYPVYIAGEGDMTPDVEQLMRWASLVLTLPVVLYSAVPFFRNAWRDLRMGRLGMDVPVAIGVGSAFAASLWATVRGQGEVYFDSVTMFVFLLLCGRYLEMVARQKALRGSESLEKVIPAFAERLVRGTVDVYERVPVLGICGGDRLRIRPGEGVPVDGRVVDGVSEADESWLTGESAPVPKRRGDPVSAGSINRSSPLLIEAEQVGERTRLASIRRLMDRAAMERPRIVEQADLFARRFLAALLVLAAATGIGWWWVDPARALWVFASVLVVSCPCALSLATPVALAVATERFGRLGLLVTRSHAIEALARADIFAFDKTGTLTEGRMDLASVHPVGGLRTTEVLAEAAALEAASEHAIGRALAKAGDGGDLPGLSGLVTVPGCGIKAFDGARELRIGSRPFIAGLAGPAPAGFDADSGSTEVFLGDSEGWRARFVMADRLRADAALAVATLRKDGLLISILSGDAAGPVAEVAGALKLSDFRAGLLPEDKHGIVAQWQAQGRVVAMVGDGVNDAPVLAQAQVSVAIGGGTDLARQQADVVLLGNGLMPLVEGRRLARRTLRVIRQNLAWSLAYNLIAIPAAMSGHVTPWMAGVGMSLSSLLVVLNALRLRSSARMPSLDGAGAG